MKSNCYLIIGKNGVRGFRKNKPDLNWDEISCKISLSIPDELFKRPHIQATIDVRDIPNTVYDPQLILNTKELIEQQTGAKIDFQIITPEDEPDK